MKCFAIAQVLFLGVVGWVRGDLTLSQEIEGGPQNGEILMRVKGDRLRLDLPGGQTGPMSTILGTKTGDTITLVHRKKIAISRTGSQAKQAGGGFPKNADSPKPRATGMKERVGAYEAEVFAMEVDGWRDTIWIVKDYPNFPAVREDLQRVSHATTGGINRAGTLDVTTLPGMVVKRQKERGGQKVTITLNRVSQDAIEDFVFEAPAEYRSVAPKDAAPRN